MHFRWLNQDYTKIEADYHSSYRINVKKALVVILFLFNVIIFITPKLDIRIEEPDYPRVIIDVESIPVTKQFRKSLPPPKPTVPIPSDDESIPEDATIEETDLKYTNFYDEFDGVPQFTGINIIPPKPIAWRFPEYPDEEKKKGVKGIVKLSLHINKKGKVIEVVVLSNTTNSEKCAQAAVEAAYGSRFFPAKENGKPVAAWISQPYRFDIKN